MYLGVDVGGTKTLVASLTDKGVITESVKFPTSKKYDDFLHQLTETIHGLKEKDYHAGGIALPGKIDRTHGVREHATGLVFGNLPWKNVPVQADLEKIIHAPVIVENDANAGAISEATLVKNKYEIALYVAIGTGIGVGATINGRLIEGLEDMEAGQILLEHHDKLTKWESFASGHAIYERFGKKASEINDAKTWKIISKDIAAGLMQLIAIVQPDVIILGGGIGTHYPKYRNHLQTVLKKHEVPLVPIPPIIQAQRPEEAVVYGCYDLAKERYGNAA